jgi:hypothetical protein
MQASLSGEAARAYHPAATVAQAPRCRSTAADAMTERILILDFGPRLPADRREYGDMLMVLRWQGWIFCFTALIGASRRMYTPGKVDRKQSSG